MHDLYQNQPHCTLVARAHYLISHQNWRERILYAKYKVGRFETVVIQQVTIVRWRNRGTLWSSSSWSSKNKRKYWIIILNYWIRLVDLMNMLSPPSKLECNLIIVQWWQLIYLFKFTLLQVRIQVIKNVGRLAQIACGNWLISSCLES